MLEELGRLGDETIYRVVLQTTDTVSTVDFVDKRETGFIHYRNLITLSEKALKEIQELAPKVYSSICGKASAKEYKIIRIVCQRLGYEPNDTDEEKEEKYKEARKRLDSNWILRRDEELEFGLEELKTKLLQLFEKHNRTIVSKQCRPMLSKVAALEKEVGDCLSGEIAAEDFTKICKDLEELRQKVEKEIDRIILLT